MTRFLLSLGLLAGAALAIGGLPAARGDDPEPRALAVTVYNSNIALVRSAVNKHASTLV